MVRPRSTASPPATVPPPKAPAFANVRLLVRDFAASWRFYRDTLGLTPGMGDEKGPYGEFVWGEEASLGLFDRSLMARAVGRSRTTAPPDSVGRFALVLESEDVDRYYEALRSRRAAVLKPPTDRPDWQLRTIHLSDPDGNVVEVYSRMRKRPGP